MLLLFYFFCQRYIKAIASSYFFWFGSFHSDLVKLFNEIPSFNIKLYIFQLTAKVTKKNIMLISGLKAFCVGNCHSCCLVLNFVSNFLLNSTL